MTEGAILRSITVVYNATWLADNQDVSEVDPGEVDLNILTRVFEEGRVAFVAAEEGVDILVVEDAEQTSSYEILIDGRQPSDETPDQELKYNTEKAVDRYFQLGTYWNAYFNQAG
jgi:LPS sulfotransferase NodH